MGEGGRGMWKDDVNSWDGLSPYIYRSMCIHTCVYIYIYVYIYRYTNADQCCIGPRLGLFPGVPVGSQS